MRNKRGQEINITTIVIIVLVILVLVVVTIGFTGGMTNFWNTIRGKQSEFNQDDINAKKTDCEQRDVQSYCTQQVSLTDQNTGNVSSYYCYKSPISANLRYQSNGSVWMSPGTASSYCLTTYGSPQ